MGLLDKFKGSGVQWECDKCGTVHKSNPDKCSECEGTVFTQYRPSSASKSSKSREIDPGLRQWRCTKCGHVHDRKPFTCDECNASTLKSFKTPDYDDPSDVPLPPRSDDGDGVSLGVVLLTLILIAILIAAYFGIGPF